MATNTKVDFMHVTPIQMKKIGADDDEKAARGSETKFGFKSQQQHDKDDNINQPENDRQQRLATAAVSI